MHLPTFPTVDESLDRLHRAGWSVGDTAFGPEDGLVWYVRGSNGGNAEKSEAVSNRPGRRSQRDAWPDANQWRPGTIFLSTPCCGATKSREGDVVTEADRIADFIRCAQAAGDAERLRLISLRREAWRCFTQEPSRA